MASTKLTNRSALEFAIAHLDNEEVKAKLSSMIAAIDRKNSAPRKPTATQVANESLKSAIVGFLSDNADNGFTVSEMIKTVDELDGLSPQKVSALLRQLKADEKVVSFADKRRTLFKIG